MEALLEFLARAHTTTPVPSPALDDAWWRALREVVSGFSLGIDRAVAAGALSASVGAAFAAGYQWAVHALAPQVPEASLAALCATEKAGGHPRAIEASLAREGGRAVLRGRKRFVTLGTAAEVLLVVASRGQDASSGRKDLVLVRVPRGREGVTVRAMPPTPFVPEVPHGELELHDVVVADDEVLPGDGFERYLRPFRTVEDCHVFGAVLGYLCRASGAFGFSPAAREGLLARVVGVRALAGCDPSSPAVHLALAGTLASARALLESMEPEWARAPDEVRASWERDRMLLSVAESARAARAARAWERVASGGRGVE